MIAEATTKLYDYEAIGRLRAGTPSILPPFALRSIQICSRFHRYYNPEIGRFISEEPLGIDGPNLYWYALNNPINFVDPDGKQQLPQGENADIGFIDFFRKLKEAKIMLMRKENNSKIFVEQHFANSSSFL